MPNFVGAKDKWKCKNTQAGFQIRGWIAFSKENNFTKFDVSI
jgi:hypothetical protein